MKTKNTKGLLNSIKSNEILKKPAFRIAIIVISIALILILPNIISLYVQRNIIMIFLYLILALSLNLISGYLGEISLGHAAFYAIGTYTSVLLMVDAGWSYWPSVLVAVLVTGVFGFILSISTMRVSGTYQCILTISFFYLVENIILNWEKLTHGAYGISGIPAATFFGNKLTLTNGGYYYLTFIYVILAIVVTYLLIHSRFGRAMIAYREDSVASTMIGINNQKYRTLTYVIASMFAGLAGSVYGAFIGYIAPTTFTYDMCLMTLLIIIIGGRGTIKGVILGAIIIVPLGEYLRALTNAMSSLPFQLITDPEQWRFVIYGIILVVMMRWRPEGILGGRSKKKYKMPAGVKFPAKEK